MVLPGQLFAFYDWGGTVDAILPALAERPVAVRNAVPYADLRAVDLLWTVDALVQQRRALPGQLAPLLDLLGARAVVAAADDDRARSGAVPPAEAADVLAQLGAARRALGPGAAASRAPRARSARRAPLPQVRAYDRARRAAARARRARRRRDGRRRQRRRRSPGWRRSARCPRPAASSTRATSRARELRRAAAAARS